MKKKYVPPELKEKKIKANFFYSMDRINDSMLSVCITSGWATCGTTTSGCGGSSCGNI